jgi:hypothetical protein
VSIADAVRMAQDRFYSEACRELLEIVIDEDSFECLLLELGEKPLLRNIDRGLDRERISYVVKSVILNGVRVSPGRR